MMEHIRQDKCTHCDGEGVLYSEENDFGRFCPICGGTGIN